MKRKALIISASLFVFIIGVYMLLAVGSILASESQRFNGIEEFTNIEDALQFQGEIVRESEKANAKVYRCDITVLSPPTVAFSVEMPATNTNLLLGNQSDEFEYGERWASYPNYGNAIGFYIASLFVLVPPYLLWRKLIMPERK